ncbi:(Fe-S)-binding protein [Candidatus Sumerlaeota bacterium]|nr:(Fe-S)-binding protein [Candidatus Sumerlaeota bacterium]
MDIKSFIKSRIDTARLEYCAICGKCLSVCPTYRELNRELHSPRGRLVLINAFIKGELAQAGAKLYEAIDWCLLCGACSTACPAGIRPSDAIMYARAMEEFRERQSWIEKMLLRKVVTSQSKLVRLTAPLRVAQQMGLMAFMKSRLFQSMLSLRLRVMQELLPNEPSGKIFAHRAVRYKSMVDKRKKESSVRIKFFVGCAMNIIFPDVTAESVTLLKQSGCEVEFAEKFYCCGAPHLHEGDLDSALQLARINVELLSDQESDFIVSDCDSCVATIKQYGELLEGTELEEKAKQVSQKTRALTELLATISMDKLRFRDFGGVRVCWADPCELLHAQHISTPPRAIIKGLPGVEFVELPESEWCCGCAGAYVLKHPEISNKVLSRKVSAIKESGVDVVLSTNPGCILQIARGVSRARLEVRVEHLSTFLARNIVSRDGES